MHNEEANRSAKEQRTRNKKGLTVIVRHVAAPDAKERLSRAIDILLRAAARDTSQAEDSPEKPSTRGTHKAADNGEMNNGKDGNLQNL